MIGEAIASEQTLVFDDAQASDFLSPIDAPYSGRAWSGVMYVGHKCGWLCQNGRRPNRMAAVGLYGGGLWGCGLWRPGQERVRICRDDRGRCLGLRTPCHRTEVHTSELQSLMSRSYAVFCMKKKK